MNKYAELANLLLLATHEFWPEGHGPGYYDDEDDPFSNREAACGQYD